MLIFLYLVIFVVLISALIGANSAAPWLPTKGKDLARMIELAKIKEGDKVYDLGCGDGRLVFASAKRGARAVGLEIFVLPYLIAKIRSWFVKNTNIKFKNFFQQNLADADVVFIFLMARAYDKLLAKFNQELRPGTRVVVYCFPINQWQDKLVTKSKPTKNDLSIYLYKV